MRTTLRLSALALTAAAALCLVAPGPPALAVEGVESGSWWAVQPDGSPLPAPPHVPPHGLWVSTGPAGTEAVSGVRFRLGATESAPILTLHVHSNLPPSQLATAGVGPPLVVACRTTTSWRPVDAGSWSARPAADCAAGAVGGALSADGTLMAFDLTTLVSGNGIDVALLPGPLPSLVPAPLPLPAPLNPGFDITFEPVSAGAVAVFTSPPSGVETGSTPPAALPSSPAETLPLQGAVITPPSLGSGGVAPVPVAPGPTAASAPFRLPAAAAAAAVDDDRSTRILAAVAFLALAAWWYRLSFSTPGAGRRPRASLYDIPTSRWQTSGADAAAGPDPRA